MLFSFGQSQHERVAVDVLRFERPDDDWLVVQIEVNAGRFRGKTDASITLRELGRFLAQLRPLYETLSGIARLDTMEDQIALNLSGDGKGHIHLKGEVRDQPGLGNRLSFHLDFDQSQLAESIKQLDAVFLACNNRAI